MDRWSSKLQVWMLVGMLGCALAQPSIGEETANTSQQPKKTSSDPSLIDSLSLTSRRDPIHIRSQTLEFLYDEKRIRYHGNVVATQGEVTLKSDFLTVTYEESTSENGAAPPSGKRTGSRQRLKEIVAEGNVEITSDNRRATGEKVVFNEANRTVILSGNAVLHEGVNQVTGERVTVFLDEGRSVVEGGGGDQRAEMVLVPAQSDGEQGVPSR